MRLPPIATAEEWLHASETLLEKEKEATRALDALAAERRRMPMVSVDREYLFEDLAGPLTLLDLFEDRNQLIVYHFMFAPGWDRPCVGCSSFVDNIGNLAHLHARDTSLALVSCGDLDQLIPWKKQMGWDVPWYSSAPTIFNEDFGMTTPEGEKFGLSVFVRDDNAIYRSYFTTDRGVDRLRLDFNLLDLTPFGRQESWEDSPPGRPQSPPYEWWHLHDEYDVEP